MPSSISDLFEIPVIYYIDLEQNGNFVLFSSNATGIYHLYTMPIKPDSKPNQITSGNDAVKSGFLSPQGDRLVYLQDKDGNELYHLFLMSKEGGDAQRITESPLRTWGVKWHPNGKEVTRIFVSKKSCGLQTFNLETAEKFILREQAAPILRFDYSHDGKWLAYSMLGGGKNPRNQQILIINIYDPTETIVYSMKNGSKERLPSWSPDDKKLAFVSDVRGRNQVVIKEFQGEDQIFQDLAEGEEVAKLEWQEINWGPKSDKVYYIVSKHGRTAVYEHPLDGEKTKLPFPEGTISSFKMSKDGATLVAIHSSISSPPGVYMHKVGSVSLDLLTPRDYKVDLATLAQLKSVWYKSFDGLKIHGWYLPSGSGTPPYPAVLWIHGGPWWQTVDAWSPNLQSISRSGFAVFAPNYRGSIGYGADFRNKDLSDPGGGDLEDVVYGAKWLRGQTEIDGSRISIMGGSYGGYMTLMALTKKPEVFSAGVALVPVVDWLEMYELNDSAFRRFTEELFEGSPAEKEALYRDRSPTTHVAQIKAPVMIIAGRQDSRCPIQPIEKFLKKLKDKGHPHDFYAQKDEGHRFARVKAHIREITAAIEYLSRILG